jgi:PAS domain-containing protein
LRHNKVTELAHSSADLAAALEAVRHGIIIVGSDWWVINLNTAAERILRAEDGLQMRSAIIAATSMPADRKLQRALHAALNHDGSRVRGGRSFVCIPGCATAWATSLPNTIGCCRVSSPSSMMPALRR